MQIGRKKMALDHLIVQKMDDGDGPGEDVQSILTYGAKQLFEDEGNARDIVCAYFPRYNHCVSILTFIFQTLIMTSINSS